MSTTTEKTPLEERLIDLIKLKGPITVADYMADALGHPHDGYYMSREALGKDGDFTTAPEISQIFGELMGLWLVEAWRALGSPEQFNLVELGPGRGVLMNDILRAAQLRPDFVSAVQVWLYESSGRLRLEQQKRLKASPVKPLWADSLDDIPDAPTLVVANEFFDCMPIRQFEFTEKGWRERMVDYSPEKDALDFLLKTTPPDPSLGLPDHHDCAPGDIFEISEDLTAFSSQLFNKLEKNEGAALIIDYGHLKSGIGDTLQAVRDHEYWPPLSAPGRADVTAHVNFETLANLALEAGGCVYGPVSQGTFLDRLGLALRAEMLCKGKDEDTIKEIRAGAERIAAPNQMGEIFKVLAVTSAELPAPAGFDNI